METILTRAIEELGTMLRWFASTFVGLVVTWMIDTEHDIVKKIYGTLDSWWLFLFGVLAFGVVLYSCHKALVHPLLFWFGVWPVGKVLATSARYENGIILDLKRSSRRDLSIPAAQNIQRDLDNWANYLHFLYCSAWAVITVPALALHFMDQTEGANWFLSFGVGGGLLVAAFYSDCRQAAREVWVSSNTDRLGEVLH